MGHAQQIGDKLEFTPVAGQDGGGECQHIERKGSRAKGCGNQKVNQGAPPGTIHAQAYRSARRPRAERLLPPFPEEGIHGDGQGAPVRCDAEPAILWTGHFQGRAGRCALDADDGM